MNELGDVMVDAQYSTTCNTFDISKNHVNATTNISGEFTQQEKTRSTTRFASTYFLLYVYHTEDMMLFKFYYDDDDDTR